jgi:hypothetical protein
MCGDDDIIFVFDSLYMLHCIYWFVCVEPTLHPWKATWSWCMTNP